MPRHPDWKTMGPTYKVLHSAAHPWHNPLLVHQKGVENVPAEGGLVYVSNHSSWWDPIILGGSTTRPVHFLAKHSLMKGPLTRAFFEGAGIIPVDRSRNNPEAYAAAVEVLRQGCVVGVYPEGTRFVGKLGPFRPGAARMALEAGVPVLPSAVLTDRFWPPGRKLPDFRQRPWFLVGKPFRLEGDPRDEVAVRRGNERILHEIQALLDEARAARDRGETWD